MAALLLLKNSNKIHPADHISLAYVHFVTQFKTISGAVYAVEPIALNFNLFHNTPLNDGRAKPKSAIHK